MTKRIPAFHLSKGSGPALALPPAAKGEEFRRATSSGEPPIRAGNRHETSKNEERNDETL